jgi:hypothetical protein
MQDVIIRPVFIGTETVKSAVWATQLSSNSQTILIAAYEVLTERIGEC